MKNKLIRDINYYIAHLNASGYSISVHGKYVSGLLGNNFHRSPFCAYVKTGDGALQQCIACQQRVFREHRRESYLGMCHAGVEEYVFFVNDKTFVSVSGYGLDRKRALKRIARLSRMYMLDREELIRIYDHGLKHTPEDMEALSVIIKPLCHMLYLLQLLVSDVPQTESQNTLFDSIESYMQGGFMQELSLGDIAQACACSESTVSHLVKQYTGRSAKQYITELRIRHAKKLLLSSDLPVGTVAAMCGFSNINYFPTAFKKHVGMNPSQYRATAQPE